MSSDESPAVVEQSAYLAWEDVREGVHARHRLVESGAYARCSCGVEFYWPERESQYERHLDERLVAMIAARVRAEALREAAEKIAPNQVRPSNVIVVGARMTDDVLDMVRTVEDALVAAVRAEAVAERQAVQRLECAGPVTTPTEPEWRATSSDRLLGRNPDRIERHYCCCVTGWDDVYEQCVLIRCDRHSAASPVPAVQPGNDTACFCHGQGQFLPHERGIAGCAWAAEQPEER